MTHKEYLTKIRAKKAKLGLTNEDIAEKVGHGTSTVGAWLTGKYIPSLENSIKLAAVLGFELELREI